MPTKLEAALSPVCWRSGFWTTGSPFFNEAGSSSTDRKSGIAHWARRSGILDRMGIRGRSAHAGAEGNAYRAGSWREPGQARSRDATCGAARTVCGPELWLVRSHRGWRSGRRSGGCVVRRLAARIRDPGFPRFPRPCCALGRRRDGSSALRESRAGSQRRSGNRCRVPRDRSPGMGRTHGSGPSRAPLFRGGEHGDHRAAQPTMAALVLFAEPGADSASNPRRRGGR